MPQKDYTIKGIFNISDIIQGVDKIQASLKGLRVPANFSNSFNTTFTEVYKQLDEIQDKLNRGFKTKGDITGLEKSYRELDKLFGNLSKDLNSINKNSLDKIINEKTVSELKEAGQAIREIQNNITQTLKSNNVFSQIGESASQLSRITSSKNLAKFREALDIGDFSATEAALTSLEKKMANTAAGKSYYGDIEKQEQYNTLVRQLRELYEQLRQTSGSTLSEMNSDLQQAQQNFNKIKADSIEDVMKSARQAADSVDDLSDNTQKLAHSQSEAARSSVQLSNDLSNIKDNIAYFFGLENAINLFRNAVRNAFETVRELDAAMTETAVVTDFTVGDMWDALPQYTKTANELGATTLGAYKTMTLFYQQGLDTNQAFEVGTETMKMARIASMDYTEATNLMTAALRGFNMELNQVSAQRINDVYSELAAITAADTHEIGVAMSKTASIAENANMEFETTAALLSQIIETTREAPEQILKFTGLKSVA